MDYTLLILLVVPLAGAVIAAGIQSPRTLRTWALAVSVLTLALAVWMALPAQWFDKPSAEADSYFSHFDYRQDLSKVAPGVRLDQSFQLRFGLPRTAGGALDNPISTAHLGFGLSLGIDGISLWLVLLTVLLMPLSIAFSWGSIRTRQREYYAWMLALLTAMLGVFLARDLLVFYIFFELTLIPMFFIIGIWGGPARRYAAGKFFLFTFGGSVFTLAAVIYLGSRANSFDIVNCINFARYQLTESERMWVVLGLLAGFAVKVPLFPLHTWLPLAHTEAPTAGSVILAGVLLKLGTYGLMRLMVPMAVASEVLPAPAVALLRVIAVLCIIGIIYGALVAWAQRDIKKLVAYSSVSHLGFCVLGLVALNQIGMQGSVLYMINHGISTGALFLVVGMIYDRYHTRDINELSGLAKRMPILAFFFVLFALSSIGLPGLNGFVSEFLTILGTFTSGHLGPAYASLAALGVILGAVYMLYLVGRVIWGPLHEPHVAHEPAAGDEGDQPEHLPADLGRREISILTPLAIAVIVLGVLPTVVLRTLTAPAELIRRPIPTAAAPNAGPKNPAPMLRPGGRP